MYHVMFVVERLYLLQAQSSAPPPPPIRASPTPMDEDRCAPVISPEPPDDGGPRTPASQQNPHTTSATATVHGFTGLKPCPDEGNHSTQG